MKTLMKNGKKYVITDLLYESLKRKTLFEDDLTTSPANPSNNTTVNNQEVQQSQGNNQTNDVVKEFYDKYGSKIISNLQKFINSVKELKQSNEDTEENKISKKVLYDYSKFEKIANVILPACEREFKNSDWVINLLRYSKEYNKSPDELAIENIKYDAADLARSNGYIERRGVSTGNATSKEGYQIFVDGFEKILKTGTLLEKEDIYSKSKNSNIAYSKITSMAFDKVKKEAIQLAKDEFQNIKANKDNDPKNDIHLDDSVKEILNSENQKKIESEIVNKIENSPQIYSKYKTNTQYFNNIENSIIDSIAELINDTADNIESGGTTLKNPNVDKSQVSSHLKKITKKLLRTLNNADKKFQQEADEINKDNLIKAVGYVIDKCNENGDSEGQVDEYCSEAAQQFSVSKEKIKEKFNEINNRTKSMKELNSAIKNVRDYNEVLDDSLEYKNPVSKPLLTFLDYFYENLPQKNTVEEASGSGANYASNKYAYELAKYANIYHAKQMEIVNGIKKVRKTVNNPIVINNIVNKINDVEINKSNIDEILQLTGEPKQQPDNKITIDYNKLENAKNEIEGYISLYSEKDKDLDTYSEKSYKASFDDFFEENGTFYKLLTAYEDVGKAVVIGCFLANASNYVDKNSKTEKKEDNSKLSTVLSMFRKYMGRNINYEDEELYNDTYLQCEASLDNSKVFIKDAKAIFRELYPFPVPYFVKGKKISKEDLKAFESNEDTDKVNLYKRIVAYNAITKYYNTLSEEEKNSLNNINEKDENNKNNKNLNLLFSKLIVKTVPDDKKKQINLDIINKLNYEFQAMEYSQLNNFYTELINDKRIESNYKIKQIFKQKAFEQRDRFLIITTKNNNFICTLRLVKILGKTRNIIGDMSKSSSPKNKIDSFFNKMKNATKIG